MICYCINLWFICSAEDSIAGTNAEEKETEIEENQEERQEEFNINNYLPEENIAADVTEIDPLVSTAINTQDLEAKIAAHIPGTSLSAQFVVLTNQAARKSRAAKTEGHFLFCWCCWNS